MARLQEEIIKSCDDDPILARGLDTTVRQSPAVLPEVARWACWVSHGCNLSGTLASSPDDFRNCHRLDYAAESYFPFSMTNLGLQSELPLVSVYGLECCDRLKEDHGWIGLLNCSSGTDSELLGILLEPDSPIGGYLPTERSLFRYLSKKVRS